MDLADRYYVESLIERAMNATRIALAVAQGFDLDDATEKLTWALDFQRKALVRLGGNDENPDGTTGPEHVTSEGVALGPPKG